MKVRKSGDGYILVSGSKSFVMDDLRELIAAKTALATFIDKLAYASLIDVDSESEERDEMTMTTTQAMRLAASQGYELGRRTVLAACESGAVEARRVGKQWLMERDSFMAWYSIWEGKKG